MAPVVEVNRAYNLISSSCRHSLSLGGGMMMGFSGHAISLSTEQCITTVTVSAQKVICSTPQTPPNCLCNEEVSVCIRRDGGAMSGDEKRLKPHTEFLRGSSALFLCEPTLVLAGCSLCSAEFECFHDPGDKNVTFPFIGNELQVDMRDSFCFQL